MKWGMVIAAAACFVQLGLLARGRPQLRALLAFGLGLLPFLDITVNPISFEHYRGDARGVEFSLVDFFALAALLAVRGPQADPTPLRARFAAYALVCTGSIALAPEPLFASFAVWKVLRTWLLFIAVYRLARGGQAPRLLSGLASGLVLAAAMALEQRYLHGRLAASGPFEHQNGLALAVNLVFPFCYALVLSGAGGRLAQGALFAGAIAMVLTLSRGGMALFVVAAVLVYLGSMRRKLAAPKLVWLALSLLAAGAVLLKSYDTIVERFMKAPDASAEARELFKQAAAAMLREHPLGVGMNQYSNVLDSSYADRFEIPEVDRNGIVHNVYWLTAAELGYLGVLSYALLLLGPLWRGVRSVLSRTPGPRGEALLGLTVSMGVTYLHGTLEWSMRMTQVGYLLWVVAALVMAMAGPSVVPRMSQLEAQTRH